MKLLLVTNEVPPHGSGIANVVFSLKTHLKNKGVKVDILSPEISNVSSSHVFKAFPGLLRQVPFWQEVADYIADKTDEYDAIWLHSPLLIDARKLRFASKLIITIHTTYYGFFQAYRIFGMRHLLPYYYLAKKLESNFFRQISLINTLTNTMTVTAVSPSVAEEARKNGLKTPIYIIPNGVKTNYPQFDKQFARALLCKEYSLQLSDKDQIILYVGRITEQKQPLLVTKVAEKINAKKHNIHLIMAGSGNLLKKVVDCTKGKSYIHVLGKVREEEKPILFQASDAFISLSCYEGLPLSVLEAASFNLPLILSDIPAHRWIIHSKIGCGVLTNPHSPNILQILSQMEYFIKSKKNLSHAAQIHVFEWKNVVNQYLLLISKREVDIRSFIKVADKFTDAQT